jgi:hypothetical protein
LRPVRSESSMLMVRFLSYPRRMAPITASEFPSRDWTALAGCGKTHPGGRPGIHPRHKANQISVGFSP